MICISVVTCCIIRSLYIGDKSAETIDFYIADPDPLHTRIRIQPPSKREKNGSNCKNRRTFYKIRIQIRPKHMGPDPNPLCQELIPRVRNRVKLKNRIILS